MIIIRCSVCGANCGYLTKGKVKTGIDVVCKDCKPQNPIAVLCQKLAYCFKPLKHASVLVGTP